MSEKMAITEFLALSPEEQELEVAKCFTEKPWKHKWATEETCSECGKYPADGCSIPDPLTLDWNTAKRLQGECKEEAFAIYLDQVYSTSEHYEIVPMAWWAANKMTASQLIAATMAAKGVLK